MVAIRWTIISLAAAASSASALFDSLASPGSLALRSDALSLLKRQNLSEGSPLYNCHDNCGQALLELQNCQDVCDDATFAANYDNCLQCAGPDNGDIWKYYGGDLGAAAAACDLPTSPSGGAQDPVGAAVPASNSTAACEAAAAASGASAAPSPTASSTSAAASASGTASSSSGVAPTAVSNMAAYGAVALGALYVVGF